MTEQKTPDERKDILARHVSGLVASQGMRVESQSDFQAILVKGKPCNHVLHGILTFFTAGMWGIVWIIKFIGREKRQIVNVDAFGNTLSNDA